MTAVVSPSVQLGSIFGALINIISEFLSNERIIQHAGVNVVPSAESVPAPRFEPGTSDSKAKTIPLTVAVTAVTA